MQNHPTNALTPFGTTVFTEISALAAQHGAVNLAQGFPDFDGPEHVKNAAIDAIRAGHAQYAPMRGVPQLTREIARQFSADLGQPVDPDSQITITSGCTEAIAATLLGILNPGDEVVLFEPYYDSYRACIAMAGGTPRFVPLQAPDFELDAAALARAITSRTRAVVFNSPHNPTGRVFTRDELLAVAKVCVERDVIAISDEVYENLAYERPHIRLASLPGMVERTITLSSLGKTFSLTGWKIGWAVASPELSRCVRAAHQFLTFAVSTPMQHAAAAALRSPPEFFANLRAEFTQRRDLLAGALRDLGFTFRTPEGGYFIYSDHTAVSRRLGVDGDVALVKYLIEKVGVAAIPPSVFYENKSIGRPLIRWAFCKKPETIRGAIQRLEAIRA